MWESFYFSILIAGFGGGMVRALFGFFKQFSYKTPKFETLYFFVMVFISGIIGLLTAVATKELGLNFFGLGEFTPALAFIVGYAGGDFLESVYKIILKSHRCMKHRNVLISKFFFTLFIFVGLAFLNPHFAIAAITQVGTTVTGGAVSAVITTSAVDTTGATLLIMTVNDYSASTATLTPSDSSSNTWTKLTNYGASNRSNIAIFYSYNKAGGALSVGAGHTFTLTQGGTKYTAITVSAWSGTLTSGDPFDVGNGSSASSGTTLQPGSITPASNGELIVTTYGSASTATSINDSFNLDGNINYVNGVNLSNTMAYIVQGTAAAVNPTWTGNYNSGQAAAIASFKPASGPTIAEVTPIYSTADNTPDYTFSSSEAGTITYGGDCSSLTTSAVSGNNTIAFNTLTPEEHTNCTITVTDASENPSNVLTVSAFSIDQSIFLDNFTPLSVGALDGQNGWIKAGTCPNWQVQSDGSGGQNITQSVTTCKYFESPINQNLSLQTSRIKADFVAVSGTQGPQVWLRRSVTGTTASGYDLFQYGGDLYLDYISGPTVTVLATLANTLTEGNWYTIELSVFNNGSGNPVLQGWIYPQGGARPTTPTISATDTSKHVTTSGYPALGTEQGVIIMDNVEIFSGDLLSSSVAVESSLLSAPVGQSITFTATVTPNEATGSVTFKDGSTTLGTGTVSGGVATYSTSSLSVGDHSITAVYGGDNSYSGSTSSAITQTINFIITITSPARNVAGAPSIATIGISRDECSETFYIPYIQTGTSLTVTASVLPASLPAGGGVKFVMTDAHSVQTVQYDMSSPFSTTFSSLAKGEYTLDTYVVDSSQVVQAGDNYHDTATNIGIGDIYIAIGDSVTEGYDGTAYNVSPYTDWTQASVKSTDNRNYPQCGISSGYYQDHWQEVSHHIALNNELESFLGYPVFILNEGVAGITSSGYITRMGLTTWQNRINALSPNKWLLHLGINDGGGSSTFQNNMQSIIDTLINIYSASSSNIILAVPSAQSGWQPYINNLVSINSLTTGPDFITYYANHASDIPDLYSGVHPTVAGHVQMARLLAISMLYPQNVAVSQSADTVTLTWNSLTAVESTIAGYKVKYGTSPGVYTTTVDVGNVTTKAITGLTSGQTYYLAVSAYDNDSYAVNQTSNSSAVSILYNNTHTITSSAGSHGSISPSGATAVNDGSDQSFTITPDAHYHVANVLVDDVSLGAVTSYDFTGVVAAHTISATFAIDTKNLTYTAGAHGSVTGTNPQTVNYGADGSAVTAVADTGYHFVNWSDDSTDNPRTDTGVIDNISVTANFAVTAPTTYTITSSAGSHGSISPSGATTVNSGDDQSFTITADSGYHVSDVLVDSVSVGAVFSYQFTNVTAVHTISATFAITSSGGGGCYNCYINPAVPSGRFKISINGGASTTPNRNVFLGFNGGADIKKMAISMTGDFTDASQENYIASKQWDLCSKLGGAVKNPTCPDGKYTIYTKFYTDYGRSSDTSIASSTITLKSGTTSVENLQQYTNLPFTNPFTKYLQYKQTNADIKRLQIFLNADPDTKIADTGAGSPGKETNYFGLLTYKAVIKFQEKYAKDILDPWGFKKGTGYIGKTTLAKINELMKNK